MTQTVCHPLSLCHRTPVLESIRAESRPWAGAAGILLPAGCWCSGHCPPLVCSISGVSGSSGSCPDPALCHPALFPGTGLWVLQGSGSPQQVFKLDGAGGVHWAVWGSIEGAGATGGGAQGLQLSPGRVWGAPGGSCWALLMQVGCCLRGLESGCHIPCSCSTPGPPQRGTPLPPVPAICPSRCQHWNVLSAGHPQPWAATHGTGHVSSGCATAPLPFALGVLPQCQLCLPATSWHSLSSIPSIVCSTVLGDGSYQRRALRIPGLLWGFGEYGRIPCR